MLIKALCDYYDVRESAPALPEGYSLQPVHYLVSLRENGEIAAITDYRETEIIKTGNGKEKEKKIPRNTELPERSKKTAIFSALIEHRPLYLFGLAYSNGALIIDEKSKKSHDAFVKRNSEFFEDLSSPVCTAFKNFINNWMPEEQTENELLKSIGKDYSNSYFAFELYNDHSTPQGAPDFKQKFLSRMSSQPQSSDDAFSSVCPIIGERLPTARIHDKIKKFPGGSSMGCVLVGMKESAYESFGKTQSYNSGISEAAMKKYTSAFNDLLADSRHRIIIDGMVMVFFAIKQNDDSEADFFAQMMSGPQKGDVDTAYSEAMRGIINGISVDYAKLNMDKNADFYVVGFTPNSSRICQKFMIHNSFGKITENLAAHQRDLAISEDQKPIYFYKIAKELVSPKSSKETVPAPLMTGIIHAALEETQYPEALLQNAVTRIKTDHNEENNSFIKFNNTRVGIIKACLNRKARKQNKKEEIKMSLDKENTNPAYLCGRLFAVLEKLQQDAAGGTLNSTIVDSYFSSACSKPSVVFPKLVELSFHHTKKLSSDSAKIFYKNLCGEIIEKLDGGFPVTLNLDDQGKFIVGYFQQNKDLYTKKEKEN